jgi:hypothetical protein
VAGRRSWIREQEVQPRGEEPRPRRGEDGLPREPPRHLRGLAGSCADVGQGERLWGVPRRLLGRLRVHLRVQRVPVENRAASGLIASGFLAPCTK